MAEQLLNNPHVLTILQQPAGEGVTEPVRRRVDIGYLADTLHSAPQVSDDGSGFTLAAPEKVLRIVAWQPSQFNGDMMWQMDFERYPRLLDSQREITILRECLAAEERGIRPAKARVKQKEDKGACARPDVRRAIRIVTGDLAASSQQCFNFFLRVGQRGRNLNARRLNGFRGILGNHPAGDTPLEEEAHMLEFFPLRTGRNLTLSAPRGDDFGGDLRHSHVRKMAKRALVAGDGRGTHGAGVAVGQVRFDGRGDRHTRGLVFNSRQMNGLDLADRSVPVCSAERSPVSLPVNLSIYPDGAGAEGKPLAFCGVGAASEMASVRREVLHSNGILWLKLKNRSGADPSEWPEDLRVQQFPGGSL